MLVESHSVCPVVAGLPQHHVLQGHPRCKAVRVPPSAGFVSTQRGTWLSPPVAAVSAAQACEVQTPPEDPPCCFPQWLLLSLSAALSPLALGRFSGMSLSRERGSG